MNKRMIAKELVKLAKSLLAHNHWRPFNESELKGLLGLTIQNIKTRNNYKVTKIIDGENVELREEGSLKHTETHKDNLSDGYSYWNKDTNRREPCGVKIE